MRKPLQSFTVLLGCSMFAAYFIHHAVYGRHGLEAQARLLQRSTVLAREVSSLELVHARLGRHVRLLVSDPPDRDIVEEIAQRELGYAYPQDTILRR